VDELGAIGSRALTTAQRRAFDAILASKPQRWSFALGWAWRD
jgi:hypothetical protein